MNGHERVFNASLFSILVYTAKNNLLTQPKKATDTMGMIKKKCRAKNFLTDEKKIFEKARSL